MADPWPLARPPRAWQSAALAATLAEVRVGRHPLVSAPCGAGKSTLIAALVTIAHRRAPSDAILVLTPRQSLVRQLSATLREAGLPTGEYYADAKAPDAPVVVACNASAVAALGALGRPVRLAVLDEAHRSSPLVAALREAAPRVLVGVTATPFCARGSLRLFSGLAYTYSHREAVADGCLVPYRVATCSTGDDLDGEAACLRMVQRAPDGPGIVFARSIADSEAFAATLCRAGIPSEAVHSNRSDRENAAALEALRAGGLRCVVHRSLLVEGVDLPWLRWAVLRRLSLSAIELVQGPGRVSRAYPGKEYAWLGDPYDLIGCPPGADVGAYLERRAVAEAELEDRPARVEPLPPAVAVDAATAWCRAVLAGLVEAGVVQPLARVGSGADYRPTARDLALVWRLGRFASYLPESARATAKALWSAAVGVPWTAHPAALPAGAVEGCPLSGRALRELGAVLEAAREASAEVRAAARVGRIRRGSRLLLELPEVPELPDGTIAGLRGVWA